MLYNFDHLLQESNMKNKQVLSAKILKYLIKIDECI